MNTGFEEVSCLHAVFAARAAQPRGFRVELQVCLAALPLTPNGKVDEIRCGFVGSHHPGVRPHFFNTGGHSLPAEQDLE